ncbi:hypothetical protein D3C86_657150 [compost metagenome]
MLNKKIEIKLGGVEIPLWFNNYASAELQKMYGADITTVMQVLVSKLQDNYLVVLTDLIKCGVKGHYLAKDSDKPEYFSVINELIADEPEETLIPVWVECWQVFCEHMGVNLPKQETVKKKVTRNTKKARL